MRAAARKDHLKRGWVRLSTVGLLAAAVAVTTALGAAGGGDPAQPTIRTVAEEVPAVQQVPASTPIRIAQSNINKDMSAKLYRADLASVFAQTPDIITFNEVQNRPDAELAPLGYQIFRTPGPRTGWAPVVWNATKWQAIGQGTVQVSKRPKRVKSGMVGVRFANWVTLMNADQQVVSVVSVHIAPNSKKTAELLVPSLIELQKLTTQLSASGPVIIGGDFNMGYRSSRYQPAYLQAAGLQSTFDILGTSFPTHRKGGTIDYLFVGPRERFAVQQQYPVEMNSDHRTVVADLALFPGTDQVSDLPTFQPGKIVVPKTAGKKERRAIRKFQLQAIRATPAGAAIHLASDEIQGAKVYKALEAAYQNGVSVTVIAGQAKMSDRAKALRKVLGKNVDKRSWFKRKPKAWRTTVRAKSTGATVRPLDPTMLLISRAGATPALSLVANATMGKGPLTVKYRKRAKARIAVGLGSYDTLYREYLAHVGRGY